MSQREELTGNFFMGDTKAISEKELEEIERRKAEQQAFEQKIIESEEVKRQEKWKDKGIIPFGFNIMIQPYKENPYLKKVNENGILLDNKTFDNPDTGTKDELDLGIPCAKVVEVGPDVKQIKAGDEVIYVAGRATPVPFMNSGFLLINEGAVLCIINTESNLKERFKK